MTFSPPFSDFALPESPNAIGVILPDTGVLTATQPSQRYGHLSLDLSVVRGLADPIELTISDQCLVLTEVEISVSSGGLNVNSGGLLMDSIYRIAPGGTFFTLVQPVRTTSTVEREFPLFDVWQDETTLLYDYILPGREVGTRSPDEVRLNELRNLLQRYRKFEPNWDRDGADAFSPKTIRVTDQLLTEMWSEAALLGKPFNALLGPLPDGRLRFEWVHNGKQLFLTVDEQGRVEVLRWVREDATESEGLWEVTLAEAIDQVRWLLA